MFNWNFATIKFKRFATNSNTRYRFVASSFIYCSCKDFCICSLHDLNLSFNTIIVLYIFSIFRLVNRLINRLINCLINCLLDLFSFSINVLIAISRELFSKLKREIVLAFLNSLFITILVLIIFIYLLYLVKSLLTRHKYEFLFQNTF